MGNPCETTDSLGEITLLYERAKSGDEDAAEGLWYVYANRLLGLARAVLERRGIAPSETSEDSVVNMAFTRFFDALSRGKYSDVQNRHDLWRLLAVITRNHALNEAKRYGRRIDRTRDSEALLNQSCAEPIANEVLAVSDMVEKIELEIQERSRNDQQADRIIQILRMTLCGHTQKEISSAIGQSEITVRRRLGMVRELLLRHSENADASS